MSSTRRAILLVFFLVTLSSVSLILYGVYLFFGAYEVGRGLDVSLSKIEVNFGSDASVTIYLLFNNTSRFYLRLVYVAAYVYLNGQSLTPYAPITSSNLIQLTPFSESPLQLVLGGIPASKIPTGSPKNWLIKVYYYVHDIPLVGQGSYTRQLVYPSA